MVSLANVWSVLSQAVAFLANLVAIAVGIFAVIGYYRHRDEFKKFFAWMLHQEFSNRLTIARQILEKLKSLQYENKEHRGEIKASLAELAGQLKPYLHDYPDLVAPYNELSKLSEARLTAVKIRGTVAMISTTLERIQFSESHRIMEKNDG